MKLNLVSFLLAIFLTACDGCKHDDPLPKTELEKLPPATQEGKHTFGCLVNGKAWVTATSTGAVAFYQEGMLAIGAKITEKQREQSIGLDLLASNLELRQYLLNSSSIAGAQFVDYTDTKKVCNYKKEDLLKGTLTITRHDPVNLIISGLFEFETVNTECDTIKITDGRFDLTYAN